MHLPRAATRKFGKMTISQNSATLTKSSRKRTGKPDFDFIEYYSLLNPS